MQDSFFFVVFYWFFFFSYTCWNGRGSFLALLFSENLNKWTAQYQFVFVSNSKIGIGTLPACTEILYLKHWAQCLVRAVHAGLCVHVIDSLSELRSLSLGLGSPLLSDEVVVSALYRSVFLIHFNSTETRDCLSSTCRLGDWKKAMWDICTRSCPLTSTGG